MTEKTFDWLTSEYVNEFTVDHLTECAPSLRITKVNSGLTHDSDTPLICFISSTKSAQSVGILQRLPGIGILDRQT